MRHYEIVFLVHPDQSEQVPAMIDRYKEMVDSGKGSVHRVEDWGRRRLAYMINDVHKAHYVMINIECELETLSDIERNFKFNDSILRHLVVRRKTAITEESAMAKAKAREDEADAARDTRSQSSSESKSSDRDSADKSAEKPADTESDDTAETAETETETKEEVA